MKKIMLIFGTRPEAIKLAPVIRELNKSDWATGCICVSAQHRGMLDQVLDVFDIIPDYDLDIMKHGQDLFDVTSKVLLGLRDVLRKEKPDMILVQGDTTTVFAASLAAFYEGIKIGHVEAGLRTMDKHNPFPEEINRCLTSVLADVNFPPTELSKNNLLAEGVAEEAVVVTGNTVIDALLWALEILEGESHDGVKKLQQWILNKIGDDRIVLITAHRRESFGQPFIDMCNAMKELAAMYPDIHYIYPVHLNPNVRKPVNEILGKIENFHLIEPLNYLPFIWLMNRSYLVLTDSGGIQEEAPSLGKPVLVMRDTTERPEGVNAGTSIIVGRDKGNIISKVAQLLDDNNYYQKVAQKSNPYGDGTASEKIISFLKNYLTQTDRY